MLPSAYTAAASRRFFSGDRFALSGSALGISVVKAQLLVEKRFDMLEGRAAGGNRFDLRLRVEKILKAETARGFSTVISTIAPHVFDGVARGQTAINGTILVKKNLLSWASGEARTEATLLTVKNLMAMAQGFATPDPRLTVEKILGAEVSRGTDTVVATPLIQKVLVSAAIGNSQAAATVLIEQQLMASVSGLTAVAAALLTEKVLGTASRGSTGVSGALTVEKALVADPIVGTGHMSGQERIWKALSGSASGIALVAAALEPPVTYRRTQSDDVRVNETTDVRQTERDVN